MKKKFSVIVGLFMIFSFTGQVVIPASSLVGNISLLPPDGKAFDLFGVSVDVVPSGIVSLVGASQGTSSVDPGAAYFFNGTTMKQKVVAEDPSPGGDFGHAVAISDNGKTAVIGAPDADGFQGAAYIFTSNSGQWVQQKKLIALDRSAEAFFGCSTDISDDGNTVIVGSWGTDGRRGAVYVFTRTGSSWSVPQKLIANDGRGDDQFGFSVAISGDGNTAVAGANNDNLTAGFDRWGSVYVFVRSGSSWYQQFQLRASDSAQYDYFGNAVDLSNDGNTAIVGAAWKGAAYVFVRTGLSWSQQKKLVASDSSGSDRFGQSVALSNNGNIAVVGAHFTNSAYMFLRQGISWNQQQKLITNDSDASRFGSAVAVSDDGQRILVGADSTIVAGKMSQGTVYIFRSVVPMHGTSLLLLGKP